LKRDLWGFLLPEYTKAGNGYRYFLQADCFDSFENSIWRQKMKANGKFTFTFISSFNRPFSSSLLGLYPILQFWLLHGLLLIGQKEVGVRKAMGSPRTKSSRNFCGAIVLTVY